MRITQKWEVKEKLNSLSILSNSNQHNSLFYYLWFIYLMIWMLAVKIKLGSVTVFDDFDDDFVFTKGAYGYQQPGSCRTKVHGEVDSSSAACSGGGGGSGKLTEQRQCLSTKQLQTPQLGQLTRSESTADTCVQSAMRELCLYFVPDSKGNPYSSEWLMTEKWTLNLKSHYLSTTPLYLHVKQLKGSAVLVSVSFFI